MAITKQQALDIARQRLSDEGGDHNLVILEDKIVEKDFGWVFLSETESFLRTGDPNKAVPGFGPLVVSRDDGAMEFIGTSGPPELGIEMYEEKWREQQRRR